MLKTKKIKRSNKIASKIEKVFVDLKSQSLLFKIENQNYEIFVSEVPEFDKLIQEYLETSQNNNLRTQIEKDFLEKLPNMDKTKNLIAQKEKELNELHNKEKHKLENELNELKTQIEKFDSEKERAILETEAKLNDEKIKLIERENKNYNELKDKKEKELNELNTIIFDLKAKLNAKEELAKEEKEKAILEIKSKLNEEKNEIQKQLDEKINELKNNNKNINSEKELAVSTAKIEWLNEKQNEIEQVKKDLTLELEQKYKDEIKNLEDDKRRLERRNTWSSKVIGEEFETEIYEKVKDDFSEADGLRIKKDNASVKGDDNKATKADFIIELFDKYNPKKVYATILIECKTEYTNSGETKTKNSQFFEPLLKNHIKKHATVSLLVSTVDPNDSRLLRDISQYDEKTDTFNEMYFLRPVLLKPFLKVLKARFDELYLKGQNKIEKINSEIFTIKQNAIEFTQLLDKKLADFNKDLNSIKKSNDKIQTSLNDALEASKAIEKKITNDFLKNLEILFKKATKFKFVEISDEVKEEILEQENSIKQLTHDQEAEYTVED
ncbi:DUF2130 domain-containing protein [Mycoplasma nasistruthionis]|uniref:DUF2130 domain-containing protein n=1 Tax=Mycoplasma nasistruthionis TaxID=353852 RepID=A0A5B7XWF6_9MOLU|nr:DUF2130 domain-containing protein [Mycoplasma nasistruthionis]QCZ36920.1 DUF2130 domain-containing protein [Mycoplasma nasistruthionis]